MSEVTGQQLYDQLAQAAHAAGVSLRQFVTPLFKEPNWKLEQLRIAKQPTQRTIDRVRALIAGEAIPAGRPSNIKGLNIGNGERQHADIRIDLAVIEQRRYLAELAHAERMPGETLAAAVKRIQQQQSTISDLGRG